MHQSEVFYIMKWVIGLLGTVKSDLSYLYLCFGNWSHHQRVWGEVLIGGFTNLSVVEKISRVVFISFS